MLVVGNLLAVRMSRRLEGEGIADREAGKTDNPTRQAEGRIEVDGSTTDGVGRQALEEGKTPLERCLAVGKSLAEACRIDV